MMNNDVKCSELGWSCMPLAVENHGYWGAEARLHLSRLASRLAARLNCSKSPHGRRSTWFLSEQMQGHCYPEYMASALTSRLTYYRLTFSRPLIVVGYFVCDTNNISLMYSYFIVLTISRRF